MRLLVELLLGLVLLSSFADAWYYRVTGQFLCYGEPATGIHGRTVEHDPNDDDITYFNVKDHGRLDFDDNDSDFALYASDPLELSIHVNFECGDCKGELYQYIDYFQFQRKEYDESQANPMIMGTVELSDVCKYGELPSRYNRVDRKRLRRKWLLRDEKNDYRKYWDYFN